MTIVIIIAAIWGASALIRAAKETNQRRKIEKIEREARQRSAEQARMREEWKQQKAEAREWTRRQVEIEREQKRQAKELEKHEAWLKKHDEEIRVLKQTVARLSKKQEDLELRIIDLESVKELVYKQFLAADHVGDDTRKEKALRKLITLDNQISTARDSRQAILDKIENANRKIAA